MSENPQGKKRREYIIFSSSSLWAAGFRIREVGKKEDQVDANSRCETCMFFALQYSVEGRASWALGANVGQCRKNAPVVRKKDAAIFPTVDGTNWCGEYQAKANA